MKGKADLTAQLIMQREAAAMAEFIAAKLKINESDLAKKVGLARAVFSRYKKEKPEQISRLLKIHFPELYTQYYTYEAEKQTLKRNLEALEEMSTSKKVTIGPPDHWEQAQILTLINEVLKLKAQATGRSLEEVIAEFDRDTRLAFRSLSK